MAVFGTLGILYLLCLDMGVLKKQDPDLFKEIFSLTKLKTLLIGLAVLLLLIVFQDDQKNFLMTVLLVILPLYLTRRSRFFKEDLFSRGLSSAFSKSYSLGLFSDLCGVVITWFYCLFLFAVYYRGVAALFSVRSSELGELLLTTVVSSILLLTLIYQASGRFSQSPFPVNVGLVLGSRSKRKIIMVPFLVGCCFASLSAYLLWARKIQPETPLGVALEANTSVPFIFVFMALALLVAPLLEEIIFRGYIFRVLKLAKGERFAFYFVALSFAVLHVGQYWGDWLAITIVMALGFVLTFLRIWAQSTLASALMHYTYNAGVVVISAILLIASNPSYFKYKAYYDRLDMSTKVELLEDSIRRQPDFIEAYNDLAWLLSEENRDLDKALRLINMALDADATNEAYLDTKAEILEKLGHSDGAKKNGGMPPFSKIH